MVLFAFAMATIATPSCSDPGAGAAPTWTCFACHTGKNEGDEVCAAFGELHGDVCACLQVRPGWRPSGAFEIVDSCPPSPCCHYDDTQQERTLGICACWNGAQDCPSITSGSREHAVNACPSL